MNPRVRRHKFLKNLVWTSHPKPEGRAGIQRIGIRKTPRWRCGQANNLILERRSGWLCGKIRFTRAPRKQAEETASLFCRRTNRAPAKLSKKSSKARRRSEELE